MKSPLETDSRKLHSPRRGVLVNHLSPAAEEGASQQGGSASRPTLGCSSVQPGHVPAHSHRGIAGPWRYVVPPSRDNWSGRAATVCRWGALRGHSSGVESAGHCNRASTQRGRPHRVAEAEVRDGV